MNNLIIEEGILVDGQNASGNIIIPENVTVIKTGAFIGNKEITSVEISKNVREIDETSFNENNNLIIRISEENPIYDSRNNCNAIIETATNTLICGNENTIIPESVSTIGKLAFATCGNLTTAVIPNGVKSIKELAFAACDNLTTVIIPDTVTEIGTGAFRDCTNLTSITIPNSVKSMGEFVFYYCENLTEVNWESPIRPTKEMLEDIFDHCPKLESINYHGKKIELEKDNLDKILTNASQSKKDESVVSLDEIIKNTETAR